MAPDSSTTTRRSTGHTPTTPGGSPTRGSSPPTKPSLSFSSAPTDDAFFFAVPYTTSTPLVSFLSHFTTFFQTNLRLHLANQVKYTCTLFKYFPQSPNYTSLAQFCSMMGSEEFYCVVIPIMTWCIASFPLSRALVLLLLLNLYVGNTLKNFFCLPRPPLKYRFGGAAADEKNKVSERNIAVDALGFGWPSTHSCNAVSLPFAVVFATYGSILHSDYAAAAVAVLYATAVPFSRLVLGVHSAADVHAGMLYGGLHLRLWVSYHAEIAAVMDSVTGAAGILTVVAAACAMAAVHPRVKPQNYTYEESMCIIAYSAGFVVGKILSDEYNVSGYILMEEGKPLYFAAARVVVGYGIVLPCKEVIKVATGWMRSKQFKDEKGEKVIEKYDFGVGDFVSRMLQYGVGYGVGCTFLAPVVFKMVGI